MPELFPLAARRRARGRSSPRAAWARSAAVGTRAAPGRVHARSPVVGAWPTGPRAYLPGPGGVLPGGAGGPAGLAVFDDERDAEALGQVPLREHRRQRPGREHRAPAQQHGVGEPLGDLLHVMGDHHHGGRSPVQGEVGDPPHEIFPAAQVKARGRLVEQQQFGIGHERTGDLNALALALRQGGEPAPDQVGAAQRVEQFHRPGHIGGLILLFPPPDDRVGGGEDEVDHLLPRRHLVGDGGTGQADPRAQVEDVGRAEPLAQDLRRSLGGEQLGRRHLEQGGLARPVGADHHPPFVVVDRPGDVAEQHGPAPPDADTLQADYLVGHPAPSSAASVRPNLRYGAAAGTAVSAGPVPAAPQPITGRADGGRAGAQPPAGPDSLPVPPGGSVARAMDVTEISVLVTLTGRDRPGVTSRLFTALAAEHGLSVLDIEQVVIRGRLVLGVLLACGPDPDLTSIHRDVRAVAADLGMDVEITMGSGEPPRRRGQLHVTVLGSPLLPAAIAAIAGRIAANGANIDRIDRLADRPVTCIELDVSGANPDALRTTLTQESVTQGVDVAVQRGGLHRRAMRLIVLDVDSTLIAGEVIDLLAARAGCAEQVAKLTAAAMRGEMEFADSLAERVALLAGLDAA